MDILPALALAPLASFSPYALPCAAMLLFTWLALRLRGRKGPGRARRAEALDTVAAWPPQAARIISRHERQALELLMAAAPGRLVLAQVPLSRFLRVPARHSYADWLQRVGSHSADLVLCDADGRVRMVVDIRAAQPSARSRQRHERLARVLRAAGIRVWEWHEGALPKASAVRAEIAELALGSAQAQAAAPTASRPSPLNQLPGHGDSAYDDAWRAPEFDQAMEPVPSDFHDDLDAMPMPARR